MDIDLQTRKIIKDPFDLTGFVAKKVTGQSQNTKSAIASLG